MTIIKILQRLVFLLVTSTAFISPLQAQRRQPPTTKPKTAQPAPQEALPTFDTLLAADSYKIYGEFSGVGQLIRSSGVNDLLDPVMKLAGPPKEFKTIVKWVTTHADALITSRMMIAAWPARANLPRFLCAIEFSSVEEAQKFEPQLLEFLPKVFPTPTPTPSPTAGPPAPTARADNPNRAEQAKTSDSAALPYLVKQSGSLLLITDAPFTFKNLRPSGSKLLVEDQNFRSAHDRFSSESIFFFFNVALEDRLVPKPESLPEGPMRASHDEVEKKEEVAEAAPKQAKADGGGGGTRQEQAPNVESQPSPAPSYSPQTPGEQPSTIVTAEPPAPGDVAKQREAQAFDMALSTISNSFFGVSPKWPEAVGAAITLDGDSYVIRILLLSGADHKPSAIPFVPQLISGPALVPSSPSILPADTELFVTASLDYQQMYDGMMRAFVSQNEKMRRAARQTIRDNEPEAPFAYYEKKIGIKIKDDLLPLLGNEIALTVPIKALDAGPPGASPSPAPDESKGETAEKSKQQSGPHAVIAIGIKDREGVKKLIPKIIDALGVKGASLFAQTEKREDTELVSYAGAFAYAFIGDFLVIGTDVPTTRHVIDSYLNHQTLASDSHFRNFTRWQPRQVLAQLYISPALMDSFNSLSGNLTGSISDKMADFLARISPVAEPVTYALSNEGFGPFHELHVPKNLVMLTVAGISSEVSKTPIETNEAIAKSVLGVVASAESSYQATTGNGNYGSLDQLIENQLVQKELLQNYGYKIEVSAAGKSFSVTAVPLEYGKTGNMSFFIDESAVLKGADHGGGPATADDQPIR